VPWKNVNGGNLTCMNNIIKIYLAQHTYRKLFYRHDSTFLVLPDWYFNDYCRIHALVQTLKTPCVPDL
jgi:hypothetical protein